QRGKCGVVVYRLLFRWEESATCGSDGAFSTSVNLRDLAHREIGADLLGQLQEFSAVPSCSVALVVVDLGRANLGIARGTGKLVRPRVILPFTHVRLHSAVESQALAHQPWKRLDRARCRDFHSTPVGRSQAPLDDSFDLALPQDDSSSVPGLDLQ